MQTNVRKSIATSKAAEAEIEIEKINIRNSELKRERENMGKSDNIGGRPAGMPGRMRGIPGLEDQDRADNAWRTLGRLSGYFLREKLLIVAVFTVVLVATICSI